MIYRSTGPYGALRALAATGIEIYGISARKVWSGKEVSNAIGYGEKKVTIYYVDGKRSSLEKALARIAEFIEDGQTVEIRTDQGADTYALILSSWPLSEMSPE